jgi:hypothetical protein
MTASTRNSNSGFGLAIATLLAIAATLVVNTLSNIFPPGGLNVGTIANTLLKDVLILPANYAFAIWGLIYVGLIAYGLYQLRPPQRRDLTLRQVNILLIVACLAQVAWIYLFTLQQFWWSVLAMLVILLPLISAYLKLRTGQSRVSRDFKWFAQIPFSVYLAWISVATIVNVACALFSSGWNGWGVSPIAWTVIMLLIGAVVAALVVWRFGDIAFGLVFIWAYGAIAVRQAAISPIWMTAVVLAVAIGAMLLVRKSQQTK